jgi:triacylglycerol lipase
MYFPYGYRKSRAIELGRLVLHAYDQYECSTSNSTWALGEGYSLIDEIKLGSGNTRGDNISNIIGSILGHKKDQTAPIGFIAQRRNALYIIFRGTRTPPEWISNVNAGLKPYEPSGEGNVHNGFMEIYKSIRENVLETIEKQATRKNIYIAGHSLGAAIATLSVKDIGKDKRNKIKGVYLYGSPRVGDAEYVKDYNKKYKKVTYRIVNTSDIVTSVPPPVPVVGNIGGYFSHIETAVDFTWQENDIVKNHKMEKYLEEIENAKEGLLLRIIRRGA